MESESGSTELGLAVIASLLAVILLTGCTHTPRSVASPGVSGSEYSSRSALNSNYYTGGDPDFRQRGGKTP